MEYRKVIKFGASSHIISLPNQWVKKNKLKKGDLIYFEENGKGEIILNPKEVRNNLKNEEITIDDSNLEILHRKLISGYIAGYDVINIVIKDLKSLNLIKSFLNSLMTFEIVDQSANKITAKDLLNINEISVDKIIKRIDLLLRSMFEDSMQSHKEKNFEEVYKVDYEVNRLSYFGGRIIKKCIHSPQITQKVGLTNERLIESWELFKTLEAMGDNIKRISRSLTKSPSIKNVSLVLNIYSKVYNEYIKAINSYYKKDKHLAYEIASKKEEITEECNLIANKFYNHHIITTLENIKTIETLIRDICRSTYQ